MKQLFLCLLFVVGFSSLQLQAQSNITSDTTWIESQGDSLYYQWKEIIFDNGEQTRNRTLLGSDTLSIIRDLLDLSITEDLSYSKAMVQVMDNRYGRVRRDINNIINLFGLSYNQLLNQVQASFYQTVPLITDDALDVVAGSHTLRIGGVPERVHIAALPTGILQLVGVGDVNRRSVILHSRRHISINDGIDFEDFHFIGTNNNNKRIYVSTEGNRFILNR